MSNEVAPKATLALSYLALRKIIGLLGLALPFVLLLGGLLLFQTGIQSSVSSYYHTGMGDVFVGTLCAVGVFLLSYSGYERCDAIAGSLGGVFAIGVALFPTKPDAGATSGEQLIGYVHAGFTALFFLTLTYFSLFLFTKTHANKSPTTRKLQRNRVYKACGYTMFISVLLAAIFSLFPDATKSFREAYHPVFWLEALAITAFGVSWLTKGEAMLKDVV